MDESSLQHSAQQPHQPPMEQQIADLRVRLQMQRTLIAIKLSRRPGKRRFRYPSSQFMRFLMRHPTMTINLLTRLATVLLNATVLRPRAERSQGAAQEPQPEPREEKEHSKD
ncbi:MAG: hypothetical protein V4751_11750 [Pseudomonadota bacterium]